MAQFRRFLLLASLIVTGLFLPLGCIPIAEVLAPLNPMVFCCMLDLSFSNQSGETVTIVPVGKWGGSGMKGILPIYIEDEMSTPQLDYREFELASGASIEIEYDADDIYCTEVLVRNVSGDHRILPVLDHMHGSTIGVRIPPIVELPVASSAYINDIKNSGANPVRHWVFLALGVAVPFLFWFQLKAYRRLSIAQSESLAE